MDDHHIVQVYSNEAFLLDAVSLWASVGLDRDGSVVLLGTSEHNAAILQGLTSAGFDVAALQGAGRLALADARLLLDRVARGSILDGVVFRDLVGGLLSKARTASPNGEVRAWGELVNLLHQQGDPPAAQALEVLWSRLLTEDDAWLLCSYRVPGLDQARNQGTLPGFAFGHTRLLLDEDEDRFGRAVGQALVESVGASEARAMTPRASPRGATARPLPEGDSVLLSVRRVDPGLAEQVLRRARQLYAGQGMAPR